LQLLCHQSKLLIQFDFTLAHVGADLQVLNGIGRKMVTGALPNEGNFTAGNERLKGFQHFLSDFSPVTRPQVVPELLAINARFLTVDGKCFVILQQEMPGFPTETQVRTVRHSVKGLEDYFSTGSSAVATLADRNIGRCSEFIERMRQTVTVAVRHRVPTRTLIRPKAFCVSRVLANQG
jgi:hypothetical protein